MIKNILDGRPCGSLSAVRFGILGGQANISHMHGDSDKALEQYEHAEALFRDLNNQQGLSNCLLGRAEVLSTQGMPDEAMDLLKEQEKICHKLRDKDGLIRGYGNQANILANIGELDKAMILHRKEEILSREIGSRAGLQVSLGNQAAILIQQGKEKRAMTLLKEQEKICREISNPEGLAASMGNQAILLSRDPEKHEEALALGKKAYNIAKKHGIYNVEKSIQDFLAFMEEQGEQRENPPLDEGFSAKDVFSEEDLENMADMAGRMRARLAKIRKDMEQSIVTEGVSTGLEILDKYENIGDEAFQKGDYESAEESYWKIIRVAEKIDEEAPMDRNVQIRLATVYLRQSELARATGNSDNRVVMLLRLSDRLTKMEKAGIKPSKELEKAKKTIEEVFSQD